MCVTAGLDLRWMTSPQTPDPKGVAHHQTGELAVQLLCVPFGDEGICQSPDLRGSRPAVMHMRPLWGLTVGCLCAI